MEQYAFENELSSMGQRYSVYIISWLRAGGLIIDMNKTHSDFVTWLRDKCLLSEDEIDNIRKLAATGSMELENSAKAFMKEDYHDR